MTEQHECVWQIRLSTFGGEPPKITCSIEGCPVYMSVKEAEEVLNEYETLKRVRNGLLWLNNNIANYGTEGFLGYLKAAIQDALLTG